jgi:hypothetical protein
MSISAASAQAVKQPSAPLSVLLPGVPLTWGPYRVLLARWVRAWPVLVLMLLVLLLMLVPRWAVCLATPPVQPPVHPVHSVQPLRAPSHPLPARLPPARRSSLLAA